jgi:hypothetical protein
MIGRTFKMASYSDTDRRRSLLGFLPVLVGPGEGPHVSELQAKDMQTTLNDGKNGAQFQGASPTRMPLSPMPCAPPCS